FGNHFHLAKQPQCAHHAGLRPPAAFVDASDLNGLYAGLFRVDAGARRKSTWQVAPHETDRQLLADAPRGTATTRAIHRDEITHASVREQPHIAVEPARIPGVGDGEVAVEAVFVEAQHHAVERANAGLHGAVHRMRRGFGKYA